jgi:hypothetical protein
MKQFLILLLVMPLISSPMGEAVKAGIPVSQEAEEDDACTVFTNALREMRYYQLNDSLLKSAFKTTIEMALTKGEALFDSKLEAANDQRALAEKLLASAQMKLASIVDYTCANHTFEVKAEAIFRSISEKYKETCVVAPGNENTKKKKTTIPDMDAYATLSYMLEKYNDLTGTSRRDMLKGSDPIAKRMVEKALESKAFAQSTQVKLVEKK